MNIIDSTYNGEAYPIIPRDYNAYFFPDNYDPDSIENMVDDIVNSAKKHYQVQPYGPTKLK